MKIACLVSLVLAISGLTASADILQDSEPAESTARLDGSGQERMLDMTTDAAGNTYVVGSFNSAKMTLQAFGDAPGDDGAVEERTTQKRELNNAGGSAGTEDIFVAKYDPRGNLLWARAAGGSGDDYGAGVAVDASGNVYITGSFTGSAQFGGSGGIGISSALSTVAAGEGRVSGLQIQSEIFAAMLDANGAWRWVKRLDYQLKNAGVSTGYSNHGRYDFGPGNTQPAGNYTRAGEDAFDHSRGFGWTSYDNVGFAQSIADGDWEPGDPNLNTKTYIVVNDDSGHDRKRGWRVNLRAGTYRFTMTCGKRNPENTDTQHVIYSTSGGDSGTVMNVDNNGLVTGSVGPFTLANDGWLWLRAGNNEDYTMFNSLDIDVQTTTKDIAVGGVFGMSSGDQQRSGKAMAIDEEGNLYLKGRFLDAQNVSTVSGAMDLRLVTATGAEYLIDDNSAHTGARNSFVTRLKLANAAANKADPAQWSWDWLTMFGDSRAGDAVTISDLAVDPEGDVFVTGGWHGNLVAGGAPVGVTNNNTEGFLLRLSHTDGKRFLLSTMRVDDDTDTGRAIFPEAVVTDSKGNAYVLGNYNSRFAASAVEEWRFQSSSDGREIPAIPGADMDFFVAKADPAGEWQWVASPSGGGRRVARSLALDPMRNLLVTGSLRDGPVTFGKHTLENDAADVSNPFLAKLTSTGSSSPTWAYAASVPGPGAASRSHGVEVAVVSGDRIQWLLSSGLDTDLSLDEAANHRIGSRTGDAAAFDTLQNYGGLLVGVDPGPLNSTGLFIGQEVVPPEDVTVLPAQPDIYIEGQISANSANYFHWDDVDKKLYLLQPVADAELRWRVSTNPLDEDRIIQPVESRLPNDLDRLPDYPESLAYQLHVSGGGPGGDEPSGEIETDSSPYQYSRMVTIGASNASVTVRTFKSRAFQAHDSWATLVFTRKVGAGPGPNTLVLPVRTRHFRDVQSDPVDAVIGTEIDGSLQDHDDPSGKNGFVLNPRSRYDGEGADAAHHRAERAGPIIPVNRDEEGEDDDLVVAWYSVSPRTGSAWPTRATLYNAVWPVDETTTVGGVTRNALEKIFIVSQLGSEMELFGDSATLATVAVNCGSGSSFTAADGTVFAADGAFTGGAAFSHARPIANTADEALFQSGRSASSFSYALPTGDGSFLVTLYFSELAPNPPTDPDEPAPPAQPKRGTDVLVEGVRAASGIVIAERAGAEDTAYTLEVPAIVTDGVLNLRFDKADGFAEAQINAIKVVPAGVYRQDKLDPAKYLSRRIYHQPDKGRPGYNPNEEHALLAPSMTSSYDAVFALRDDLNHLGDTVTSDPYTLMKYRDAADGKWKFKVYQVAATGSIVVGGKTHTFDFTNFKGFAGRRVQAPYPLSLFPDRAETDFETPVGVPNAYWKDHKGSVWARCAGQVVAKYWYPLQSNFWFDKDGDGVSDGAAACPWLEFHEGPNNTPAPDDAVRVFYDIEWPPLVPKLFVGETLREAKRGMPDVRNWAAGALIFDENEAAISQLNFGDEGSPSMLRPTARLIDSMSERAVPLAVKVAGKFLTDEGGSDLNVEVALAEGGRYEFPLLPPHLRPRLRLDTSTVPARLLFRGLYDTSQPAAPLELLNVLSRRERDELLAFGGDDATGLWEPAVEKLFELTRNPNGVLTKLLSDVRDEDLFIGLQPRFDDGGNAMRDILPETVYAGFALTAGLGEGEGYITLSENNDPALGPLPVALHVIRVVEPPVVGSVRVILSQNPLDEKVTLRHSADFGGDPDGLVFEWYVKQDVAGRPEPSDLPPGNGWLPLDDETGKNGLGLNSITIEGSGIRTLADHWAYCRYRKADAEEMSAAGLVPRNSLFPETFGGHAGDPAYVTKNAPMFVPGWIKRVLEGLNPFEQRVKDFHQAPTSSYVSMIQQAGGPYRGPVALNSNADNLNQMGLIELYETVVHRGFDLSINGTPSQTNGAVNNALLLAASRISDLYMLLGNEAYADAQDPTIGVGAGAVNVVNSSTFAFQNQLPNLIEEELALLRGRDASLAGVQAAPVFNRLYWNFTSGLEGEPAYVLNYEISDTTGSPTGGPDGFIRENDAAVVYPMGHGDAWGHYLSAAKSYYRLLRHPLYTWTPRSETTLVAGVSVTVDYLDEVKFARAAAARARAAESIVDLTYRGRYVADPAGQWQGYKDTDAGRAWGVDEWARRSGQGAVLDWAVANAVLPEESPTGTNALNKIDRQTVTELNEIVSAFVNLQGVLDRADQGLNPLGLHNDVVPFDIDPQVTDTLFGQPHFEQIYARAEKAVSNARGAFEHASGLTQQLRSIAMSAEQYRQEIAGQEVDFKNRLIEVYGYPYSGDIGPGKTYPTGYDGPDLYKWMYVPVAELTDETLLEHAPTEMTAFYAEFRFNPFLRDNSFESVVGNYFPDDVPEGGSLHKDNNGLPMAVDHELSAGRWAFAAPPSMGARRAPGRLQMALNAILEAQAGLETAATNYDGYVLDVRDAADLLKARFDLHGEVIEIKTDRAIASTSLDSVILALQTAKIGTDIAAEWVDKTGDAVVHGLPKVAGALVMDPSAPARGSIRSVSNTANTVLKTVSAGFEAIMNAMEFTKSQTELWTDLEIEKAGYKYEIQEQLKALEQLLRNEINMRLEIFEAQRRLAAAVGDFQATLAEGQRAIEERLAFRRKMAGPVQQLRYQDITFRNYRNEALQRYKASFDLAGRYLFLAAKAYDYETCLLGSSTKSGQQFLNGIIRQRALGQFNGDDPVHGVNGLSDPMSRMKTSFDGLKSQLGFNNPQMETGQFSLRHELFRLRDASDEEWQEVLARHRVADLWQVPEFKRYCRPFAPEAAGPQPGLVIPFGTNITYGLNFFGWPLAGGDSAYDSSRYATKARSVGVWFENYSNLNLSTTPRIYLVPVGLDILRTPTGNTLATREFNIVDQALPDPFPIGASDLSNPRYIPMLDSLDGGFTAIRQFGRFRAYHSAGAGDLPLLNEMTTDSRLVGRSVWNTRWLLIVPGGTFLGNADEGLETFIFGKKVPGSSTERDGNGNTDIKLFFETYSYQGL